MGKGHDDYDEFFSFDDEDSRNYEELDGRKTDEEIIAEMDGTVISGQCMYCGAPDGMKYEGDICFICSECGKSTHKDTYYLWLEGRC